MIRRLIVVSVLLATPAHAESSGQCRGEANSLGWELTLHADGMSPTDRVLAEQRLRRAQSLCPRDSGRARQDMQQLHRDILQHAARPDATRPQAGGPGRR